MAMFGKVAEWGAWAFQELVVGEGDSQGGYSIVDHIGVVRHAPVVAKPVAASFFVVVAVHRRWSLAVRRSHEHTAAFP